LFHAYRQRLQRLLDAGGTEALRGSLKGLEKESLRVSPEGHIAQTPHPASLGSALTHPTITTDYSEALLEFITPPFAELSGTLRSLEDTHAFTYQHIGDELLWATSMPCVVGGDDSIPIARYGTSNLGLFKHIYRRGLGLRYGRMMQAIAGVHFNFSLPRSLWPLLQRLEGADGPVDAYRSAGYFRLIRNFQRYGWLVPYLFGASPAVCRSFLQGRPHSFQSFDACTLFAPYATSLRMSDIGYKNKAQANLHVSYDGLTQYVSSLTEAIFTPDPEYTALGTHDANGEWQQLNGNVLQIENEYYSFVRPKAVPHKGERPTQALARRGVEYVEIRALDVNPFAPAGVDADSLRLIEALLWFCLLEDSPPVNAEEQREISHNQALAAGRGREPGLTLRRHSQELPLKSWALALLDALEPIAAALDAGNPEPLYGRAVAAQRRAVEDPLLTPSARVLSEMETRGESFTAFAMRMSRAHERHFKTLPLPAETIAAYREAARLSLAQQAELEADRSQTFEEFLAAYFA